MTRSYMDCHYIAVIMSSEGRPTLQTPPSLDQTLQEAAYRIKQVNGKRRRKVVHFD